MTETIKRTEETKLTKDGLCENCGSNEFSSERPDTLVFISEGEIDDEGIPILQHSKTYAGDEKDFICDGCSRKLKMLCFHLEY